MTPEPTGSTDLARWQALWQRLGAKGQAERVYADLVARYSEPHRAYHTLDHVAHCLAELDAERHLAQHPDEVELAVWFHDAVCDPQATTNEVQSAELAYRVARASEVRQAAAKRVYHLILATRHKALPTEPGQQLLADVDLAILGQPEETFGDYERRIRREYAWVGDAAYLAGRAALFEQFLARPQLYATDTFHAKYEARARANLRRALARLRGELTAI